MSDSQLDKSELNVPEKPQISPEQLKTPKEGNNNLISNKPLREQNRASENQPTLPNTGTSGTDFAVSLLCVLGILGLLGFGRWKKLFDLES